MPFERLPPPGLPGFAGLASAAAAWRVSIGCLGASSLGAAPALLPTCCTRTHAVATRTIATRRPSRAKPAPIGPTPRHPHKPAAVQTVPGAGSGGRQPVVAEFVPQVLLRELPHAGLRDLVDEHHVVGQPPL